MYLLPLRPIKSKPVLSHVQAVEVSKIEDNLKDFKFSAHLKMPSPKSRRLDTLPSAGSQPPTAKTSAKRAKLPLEKLLPANTSMPSPVEADHSEPESEDVKPLHIVETPTKEERPLWAAVEEKAKERGQEAEGPGSLEDMSLSLGGG